MHTKCPGLFLYNGFIYILLGNEFGKQSKIPYLCGLITNLKK